MNILFKNSEGALTITPHNGQHGSIDKHAVKLMTARNLPEDHDYHTLSDADVALLKGDGTFRDAMDVKDGKPCVCIEKAKVLAHKSRREIRNSAYKEIDGGSQYATLNEEGELKRKGIKEPDDVAQVEIDSATDTDTLQSILNRQKGV